MSNSDWLPDIKAGGIIVSALLGAIFIAANLTAERPFNFSLVDRDCRDAQEQYHRARQIALERKELDPAEQNEAGSKEREHADVCAQSLMAEAAARGYWLLLFSLVFAGGAAVAAWLTLRTMRITAERQLRAYVRITYDSTLYKFHWAEGVKPLAGLVVDNVGVTPAFKVIVRTSAGIASHPLVETLPDEAIDEHTSRLVLHPNGKATYRVELDRPLTKSDITEINRPDASTRIYLYGRVDYVDAFGRGRWTTFRMMTNWVGDKPSLMNCADGNDAT